MASQQPLSLLEFQARFNNEQACRDHFFRIRWPHGYCCPKCGHKSAYFISTRNLYQCKECSYQVSLTAGTVMHKTRTPLLAWFWAIYLIAHDKRGCSALSLKKAIGVSYQTAWSMSHKIKTAMGDRDANYQLAGLVRIDDAYFGGPSDGADKSGRGTDQTPVIVAVSVDENNHPIYAKMEVVEDLDRETAKSFVLKHVAPGSTITTDGLNIYTVVTESGFGHERVIVSKDKERALETLKWVHTVISNAKAFIAGTFHGLDRDHLQRYLDEYCYRFNRRQWEQQLFNRLLTACAVGTPVTYYELVG